MSNPFLTKTDLDIRHSGLVRKWISVTPNDSADNCGTDSDTGAPNVAIVLYAAGAGDVAYQDVDGDSTTVTLPANAQWVTSCRRVLATGTTATGIMAGIA